MVNCGGMVVCGAEELAPAEQQHYTVCKPGVLSAKHDILSIARHEERHFLPQNVLGASLAGLLRSSPREVYSWPGGPGMCDAIVHKEL